MTAHSGQHVMAILPGSCRENQVGFRVDIGEDVHAHPLAGDEAVTTLCIDRKGTPHGNAGILKTLG